jgi:hypothetical protein
MEQGAALSLGGVVAGAPGAPLPRRVPLSPAPCAVDAPLHRRGQGDYPTRRRTRVWRIRRSSCGHWAGTATGSSSPPRGISFSAAPGPCSAPSWRSPSARCRSTAPARRADRSTTQLRGYVRDSRSSSTRKGRFPAMRRMKSDCIGASRYSPGSPIARSCRCGSLVRRNYYPPVFIGRDARRCMSPSCRQFCTVMMKTPHVSRRD